MCLTDQLVVSKRNSSPSTEVASEEKCRIETSEQEGIKVVLPSSLDFGSAGESWKEVTDIIKKSTKDKKIIIDGSGLRFCDSAGVRFLAEISPIEKTSRAQVTMSDVPESILKKIEEFRRFREKDWRDRGDKSDHFLKATGKGVVNVLKDLGTQVEFLGELLVQTMVYLSKPAKIPWREIISISEKVGARAIGIVSLISFLIGLIMAFQSAIPMKQFGAELFVADLVGISLVRELGPLMTAILLAGRSGAAFAAEIGTMRVNEEIDALTTMGLKPVRFLVVSRVIATVIMTPILTAYADLMGLVGGGVVFCSFGFPLVTYFNELDVAVKVMDFVGGTAKSFVFGFIVAAIGCLRGLQTKSGASAVGQSTTSAVVSGIILIVVADGIFSVIYYYLEI